MKDVNKEDFESCIFESFSVKDGDNIENLKENG